MSRQREYRGKRVDGGGWVYGSLVQVSKPFPGDHIVFRDDPYEPESWYEVEAESVGENTGLVDLDGTPIYEGDFLIATIAVTADREMELHRAVKFYKGAFTFGITEDPHLLYAYAVNCVVTGRVIGNETDNPVLVDFWREADEKWKEEMGK